MKEEVKKNLDFSVKYAIKSVYPKIIELGFLLGTITPIEVMIKNKNVANAFDRKASIDAFCNSKYGIQNIANRVQWVYEGKKPFNSFTIRSTLINSNETEYHKIS